MIYEIQHFTLCDGWINTFSYSEDGENWNTETYLTQEAAQKALDAFLFDIALEIEYGQRDADDGYDESEFRIAKIGGAT